MSAAPLVTGPGEPADVLFRDVRVVDPRERVDARRDVLVGAGRIVAIGEPGTLEAVASAEVVDGAGHLVLLPAFFDPHVHLRTPGQEHKEDLQTGTAAAAAGGYAGVIAMPNTDPVLDSAPLLRSLCDAAARDAHVAVGFLPAITRGLAGDQLTEMAELREAGALGFTDDGRPVRSAGMLRKALQYQRLCGGVIALHEEDPTLSRDGAMHEGAVSAALGIAGIPTLSESTMVARDAALAGYEGGRVHFQHLSCVASVEAVAAAKAAGFAVSAEVSPHHLLLTEEAVRGMDTNMKMNPPLATEADRRALVDGLRNGTIDCVATDHAPHAREEKDVPFEQAPMGTTGLETAFAALHTELVLPGELELAVLVERMSAGAELFGLPAPRIAAEGPADMALVDLDAEWVAGEHGWRSRSANCCFAQRPLRGRVLMTLAAGAVAHRESDLDRVQEQLAPAAGGLAGGPMSLLARDRAALVVIDIQEGFRPYAAFAGVAASAGRLLEAARILGVPALVSEQYPKGLGATAPEVGLGDEPRVEKTVFSAARADGFDLQGRSQAVVCGIETHVCVSQTVHDLLDAGVEVHVPADAVGSRHELDHERGLERMERAGAVVSSVEAALFELLERAGTPEFKAVQQLIL